MPWEDLIDIACLYGFKPHDRKNHGSLCRACKSRSSRCTKHIRPKRLSTTPAQILSSESQMHSEDRPRTAAITPSYSARPSMLHLPSIPVTMNTDLHNKVLSSHHLEAGTFAYNILFLDHNPAYDFVEHHEHPSPLRFQSTQPAKSLPNPPWSSHSDGNLADNPHKLFPSEATNRNHTRQPEPATAQTSSTIYVDTSPVSPPKPTYIKGPNPTVPIAHPRTPLLTLKFRPVSPGLSRALPRTVLPPLLKVDLPSGLSALPLRKYPRNSCEPSRDDDDEAIADEFAKQLRETQRRQQGQDEVEREGYEEHASQMRTAAAIPTVASQTPSTKLAVLRAAGRLAENHSRTYAHTQSA